VRARILTVLLLMGIIGMLIPTAGTVRGARAAPPPPRVLRGQTPAVVVDGRAAARGQQDPATPLTLNIGLAAHDSAALDALIAAASDSTSSSYGHYLTPAQYMARFAPTDAEVAAVRAWAATAGLQAGAVSPDHLLVTVGGTAGAIEQALGVRISTYSLRGRVFRANDHDPVVPTGLDIRAISGLSTLHRFYVMQRRMPATRALTRTGDVRPGGYYPNDFRAAYNMGPLGDGSGQTIGLTLWGAPVAQSDLNQFASNSGTAPLVGGQAGADGIDWIPVNGGSSDTTDLGETAMDVEYAHGVAPGSHLKYWLSDCGYDPTTNQCTPSDTGLEQAISDAANDTSLHLVSNSWGGGEATSAADPFVSNTNASFQHAASVGTTFYFSSGDSGAYGDGATVSPSYPADSPYVVAVGGTNLTTGASYAYGAETTWTCASLTQCTAFPPAGTGGSGGGCSTVFARPSWQTGVGAATCSGRAEPDIAADADPHTGADVYYQGRTQQIGGTSLAAPLWSGMAAVTNRYLTANGQPLMGFSAPRIYQLANNATTDARDFHDVTSGSNGYPAGTGWDEATGWGSPNLANLAADWTGAGGAPTSTATATVPPSATAAVPTAAVPTATNTSTSAPSPTSTRTTAPIVIVSPATATPVPSDTATLPPVSTNTSTAMPSPTSTATPMDTATPAPTNTPAPAPPNTSTATPLSIPTALTTSTATARAGLVAVATPATTFISTSARMTATPTPQAVHTARRSRVVTRTATPVVAADVRVPTGGVTLNSVVTVNGRTRPATTVAISASLTTTSTLSQRAVIYVFATANARRTSSKKGVKPAATRTCRKGMSGCVARVVMRRVVRTTLLYRTRTATRARAGRVGRFSARVRLDYRPRQAARVMLTVTLITVTPRGRFARAMLVKVTPPRPQSGHRGVSKGSTASGYRGGGPNGR